MFFLKKSNIFIEKISKINAELMFSYSRRAYTFRFPGIVNRKQLNSR